MGLKDLLGARKVLQLDCGDDCATLILHFKGVIFLCGM